MHALYLSRRTARRLTIGDAVAVAGRFMPMVGGPRGWGIGVGLPAGRCWGRGTRDGTRGESADRATRGGDSPFIYFTASGGAVALLALYAAIERDFPLCFAWLGVALFIDGIDGTLARFARVSEIGGHDRRRRAGSRRRFPDLCARSRRRPLAVRSDAGPGVVLAGSARHLRVRALFRRHADEDPRPTGFAVFPRSGTWSRSISSC